MHQAKIDFKKVLNETYQQVEMREEKLAYQQLVLLMQSYAPKLHQTEMYEIIYDLYIEEQTPVLNQCLELVSGWQDIPGFMFLNHEMQ